MWLVLGAALAGLAALVRKGRPMARPAPGFGGRSPWSGRLERRLAAVSPIVRHDPAAGQDGDAALLGHEMKNYLCTLRGNAHLLRQRMPGQDQDILDRIDRVVESLETFSRNLSGAREAATASGALWYVQPADTAQACARTHFHRDLDVFRWEAAADAPTLLCDPDRLEQVFLNLYANAMEAGARNVATTVRREGSRLVVRIEDDGKGCAQEDLERIFEPFFTTKQGPARRGLGMFIVQSIVENHGGCIRVGSKNGTAPGRCGMVFTLEFPIPPIVPSRRGDLAPVTLAPAKAGEGWLLAHPEAL
jgi:signal transduction histidine kinase